MNYPSIKFVYEYPTDYHSNGVIKLEIEYVENNNINFPLTFQVIGLIDNKIYWETKDMMMGYWSSYADACNKKAIVIDSKNNIIKEWIWKQEIHGDKIHKDFYNWCLLNKGANGIAIGTNNGSTGEWVTPIREQLINGYLVEPSDIPFKDLCDNYKGYSNVNYIQKLITKDGGYVDFFEGDGDGCTNSVNREFTLVYNSLVKKVQKQSITINQLIIKCGLKDNLDWLHIDTEDLDDQLIMSLDDKLIKLPNVLIYEDLNLSEERKCKLNEWLKSKNYNFYHSGFNTMAQKQTDEHQIKVSVIIPCYNYSKYIEQCLMSVVLQNIDFNMEIIISDDGSNDAGFNIIERFCESYKKDNIFFKIYSQGKNIGEINNTKFLLENSNGEYVAYLDADDYWIDPNKLKKQIEFMDNNLDYSLCITGYYRIENDEYSNLNGWSCPTDINGLNSKSLTKYNIVGSSSSRFFRNYKNLVKDYFYEFPFSDWPLNFELSLKGKIWYLDYPSYIYRIHDNSLTSRTEIIVNEKRINILKSILDTNKIKKTYITHVTKDYLEVSLNLAKSIELFSKIPLIIYCINLEEKDKQKFNKYKNVQIRNINLDISEKNDDDYLLVESGNFYINRFSTRIYNILCCKTIAMEMALEEGWDEVCYLDSDCLATPLIDQLFDWCPTIVDYPIATKGIHDYMMLTENGVKNGDVFVNDQNINNKLCLEWPLMNFLELNENDRGSYRTTGIMLMNKNCLPFIKTWKELCFILPKLVNVKKYAPYHEETIYNVLSWKKTNKGFPLCYINLSEGLKTVQHFYLEGKKGYQNWDDDDDNTKFYKIPENKSEIKVLHGEKRTDEVNLILDYLLKMKNNNYFN